MIAFGVCVGDRDRFDRHARRGLERCRADPVWTLSGQRSIFEAYNVFLDRAAEAEALVLLHEDVEIRDPDFQTQVRQAISDPSVAIAGAIGGRGLSSAEWWTARHTRGAVDETRGRINYGLGVYDVDAVDGLLLVLSPWAIRNLRFDEVTFSGFHGYDVDICFQARAAGKRVITTPLNVFHAARGGVQDESVYIRADAAWQAKWATRPLPPVDAKRLVVQTVRHMPFRARTLLGRLRRAVKRGP